MCNNQRLVESILVFLKREIGGILKGIDGCKGHQAVKILRPYVLKSADYLLSRN